MKKDTTIPPWGKRDSESPVMDFLNSAFVIWFLSSVVLGGLTWAYTQLDAARTERQQNAERLRRVSMELSVRTLGLIPQRGAIGAAQSYITSGPNLGMYIRQEEQQELKRGFALLAAPDQGGVVGLFPEFKDRDLVSVFYELTYYVSPDKQADMNKALYYFNYIASKRERMQSNAPVTVEEGLNLCRHYRYIPRAVTRIVDPYVPHSNTISEQLKLKYTIVSDTTEEVNRNDKAFDTLGSGW